MKFVIFNLMAAAAIVYLAGETAPEDAGRIATRVTATVQKAVSEGRRVAGTMGTDAAAKAPVDVPAARPDEPSAEPAVVKSDGPAVQALAIPSGAGPVKTAAAPERNPAAASAGTGKTEGSAARPAAPPAAPPSIQAPDAAGRASETVASGDTAPPPKLAPAVEKRRAEVLGEPATKPPAAAAASRAEASPGFMSKRERARELRRLAEEMEYVFVGKVIGR